MQCLLHLRRVALRNSGIPGAENLHVGPVAQQVRRKLQLDGPGAPVPESLERFQEIVRDSLYLADHGVPVGDRLEHPQLVLGLVGGVAALPYEVALHVGGDLEQRRAGEVSLAHRAHGVGGARAGAGDEHARLAGGPGVAVGHEAAAQLQPSADEPQAVLPVEQGVEQIQVMYADDAEYCVNALGLQGFGNGLASGQVGHGCTP